MTSQGSRSNGAEVTRLGAILLGSLFRRPLHGYSLKMELRYKHVDLWARCDHGHIYYTLKRLETAGLVASSEEREGKRPTRQVYRITPEGRRRFMEALHAFGSNLEETYFDVDLFLANCWGLPKDEALGILERRLETITSRLNGMREVEQRMRGRMPLSGELILSHRLAFLVSEGRFVADAIERVQGAADWGSFFGDRDIEDVAREHGVDLSNAGPDTGGKGRKGRRGGQVRSGAGE